MTTEHRLPQLTDGTLDWGDAAGYKAAPSRSSNTKPAVTVAHELTGVESIQTAVDAGDAQYSVEVRSPRTLFAEEEVVPTPSQTVQWDASLVDEGGGYLLGSITVTRDNHRLSVAGLHEFFANGSPTLDVPAGWRLAVAAPFRLRALLKSMVVFRKDDTLPFGRMTVDEDAAADTPRFIVRCAPDVHEVVTGARSAPLSTQALHQQVALTGVCALLPNSQLKTRGDQPGKFAKHAATHSLAAKFQHAGVGDWDEEGWDPVAAATALLPIVLPEHTDHYE